MWQFFKPWRRKVGVLTLAVACVFAVAWIRGSVVTDFFYTGNSKGYWALEVREHYLMCGTVKAFGRVTIGSLKTWEVFPKDHMGSAFQAWHLAQTNERWDWRWRLFDFDCGRTRIENGGNDSQVTLCVIPHWAIVIPLILTSCWLLLPKPNPCKSQSPAESTPETGLNYA